MNSLKLEFYKKELDKKNKIVKNKLNIKNFNKITLENFKKLLYLCLLIYVIKLLYDNIFL